MEFAELPEDVQRNVKSVLKAFPQCVVTRDGDDFVLFVGATNVWSIQAGYSLCGIYKAEDVYTIEERRQNYYELYGLPNF